MALSPEQVGQASGQLARSLTVNAAALVACRYLFSGFEIQGFVAYLAAASAIELPNILWLLTARWFFARMSYDDRVAAWPRAAQRWRLRAVLMLTLVIPLALATMAPGLALAAGITRLQIAGGGTFAGASAVTAALTIAFSRSQPLRYVSRFVKSFGSEEQRRKSEEANAAFRESGRELGRVLRDALLQVWVPHRNAVRFARAVLSLVALVAGTLAVGEWFGVVLALVVALLPAAILWLAVRSKRAELRSRANP